MPTPAPKVISASRRTDIPAFYMSWFMAGVQRGELDVVNPYSRQTRKVDLRPDTTHSIVFWSKNFGPFLAATCGERLQKRGYHLFFNFTVNSPAPLLEPGVPPLKDRLQQASELARRFGAGAIQWRFDPICFYQTHDGRLHDNMHAFIEIADQIARAGIRRCITSFRDDYAKIGRRTARMSGMRFVDPPLTDKAALLGRMAKRLADRHIQLYTCCEAELLAALPKGSRVKPSACIPNDLLLALYGGRLSLSKDTGQRRHQGCGCQHSVDIGSYHRHPCFHNCLFCYANPARDHASPATGASMPGMVWAGLAGD